MQSYREIQIYNIKCRDKCLMKSVKMQSYNGRARGADIQRNMLEQWYAEIQWDAKREI